MVFLKESNNIASLRDLRGETHLKLLQSMMEDCTKKICDLFSGDEDDLSFVSMGDQLKSFVTYQPECYQFHVHFTSIDDECSNNEQDDNNHMTDGAADSISSSLFWKYSSPPAENIHLLSDIVQNLEMDSDYYTKRKIVYSLPVTDELYKKFLEYKKSC
mmetsp:Transcript_43138/g.65127  ORF Transcript_43138/g.65127 Transcript_43138/m.65127 type:complete len:159 (-) Transcript_43138:1388-1864(-)